MKRLIAFLFVSFLAASLRASGGGFIGGGGAASGVSNPSTADLNMGGYKITNASAYESSGSTWSVETSTFNSKTLRLSSGTASQYDIVYASYTMNNEYFQLVTASTSGSTLATNYGMPGIGTTVLAGATYFVEFEGYGTSVATTTGVSLMFDGPAGSTVTYWGRGSSMTNNVSGGSDNMAEFVCGAWLCKVTMPNTLVGQPGIPWHVSMQGYVQIGTTGTMDVKFTTETNGSSVSVSPGSRFKWWKVYYAP